MVVPDTVGPVRSSGVPSLSSCASTINKKISEGTRAEFNSKVQIKVISEPRVRRRLVLELCSPLINVIEDGVGTLQSFSDIIIIIIITLVINSC